jgi:hypothetical protein
MSITYLHEGTKKLSNQATHEAKVQDKASSKG